MNLGIVVWIFLGAIAGFITGKLAFGHGFGAFVDAVAGACGAVLGFTVSRHMGLGFARKGLVAALSMAIIGAIFAAWIVRVISRHTRNSGVVVQPPPPSRRA